MNAYFSTFTNVACGGSGNTLIWTNAIVVKNNQTITFGAQTAQTYSPSGTFAISPVATASSGLAVTYSSLTTGVCTIAGTTVTIVTAGTCTIAANQAGNANWYAAPQVTQNITINNPVPTTTSISPTSKNVGDALFTMTVNGTNFVSTSVVNFAGSARTTTFVSATQLTVTIPASDMTVPGTFNITVFNPTPGGGTSNAQTFTVVVVTPGSFNVFETGTAANAVTGSIFTKLAGVGFSLDVVAILSGVQMNSFTNTVQVDLVTGSAGGLNCPGTPATIAGTTQNVNLTGGRGTTGNFNVASAAPNVRVRVRYPVASPTVTSCSTDNFSIRPTAFTVTSTNATQTGSSGTPAIKTGANFNLTAASVAGYDGTPSVDSTKVVGTPTAGTIGGSFSAAPAGTGTATGASFFYSEAGNFGLNANAVYDSSFTSVDSSPSDCNAGFSNILDGAGRYGCSIGSTAIAQSLGVSGFGRFIPDNFNVTYLGPAPTFTTGCGTFSYIGTAFAYGTAPVITVTARNSSNATTTNYAGSYMKITNATLTPNTIAARYSWIDSLGVVNGTTPGLDTSNVPGAPGVASDPVIGTFTAGVGTLTFASGTGLKFTRSTTTPNAPFDADIALALNVIDTDGVAFASNPASFGAAASGNGIAFPGGKEMRFGRLFIPNTYGTEKLNLTVPLEVQYLTSGSIWARNTLDNCTSINLDSGAQLANKTGAMSGSTFGPPAVYFGTTATTTATMVQGLLTLTLSKPNPIATGYVDLGLNLDTAGSAQVLCPPPTWGTPSPASVSGLGLAHLRGQWCSTSPNYDRDPSGRLTLGISRNKFIFNRENY